MGILRKCCLSALVLIANISCNRKDVPASNDEQRLLAEAVYKQAIQYRQGSPKCMNLIEEAIQIDSTYAEAIRELSVAYLKRGMPHKWKPLIDRAVYHDPKTWRPVRATAYLKFYRDYKKAIEDLDAVDGLTPNFVDYTGGHSFDYWRGIAYLGLRDYQNCIQYFDKHIKKETEETGEDWVEINAFLYRAIAHYESGNFSEALTNLNKIIHYFKYSADAKYYKAKILSHNQGKDSARFYIKQAKADFQEGYFNYGNYNEALRQIYWEDLEELENSLEDHISM